MNVFIIRNKLHFFIQHSAIAVPTNVLVILNGTFVVMCLVFRNGKDVLTYFTNDLKFRELIIMRVICVV